MLPLLPTKRKWTNWSLPAKLTAIGTYVGLVSLALTVLIALWPSPKSQPVAQVNASFINSESPVVQTMVNSSNSVQIGTLNVHEATAKTDVFRAVSPAIRAEVLAFFRSLHATGKDLPLLVIISVEIGSRNRLLLRSEIARILRDGGIDVDDGEIRTTVDGDSIPAISVSLSEETRDIGNALVRGLTNFIKAEFPTRKRNLRRGAVNIHIYGDPQFDAQGVVFFQ